MVTDRARKSTEERRHFGRFVTQLPVRTQRDDLAKRLQADRRTECRLQLRDFSLGGLRAESAIPLKVDERLTLHLPPVGRQPPVQLTGRVIHCRRQDNRYSVGIAFHDTKPAADLSPYRYLPRLFSLAADFAGEVRPIPNGRGKR
ncbi:MAG: PilZ domain-containing protein [Planctomycetes bacterium]|nr:PilZ domain-containing protein [Planctomycetota bacterium]